MTRTHDIHTITKTAAAGARLFAPVGARAALAGATSATGTVFTQDRNHIVLAARGAG
jgi:hypothetical protein